MNTPICDFVRAYTKENPVRFHMPGHKGVSILGVEHLDITEIRGADSLYEADGIIAQSEENASRLFGCKTLYSTEGSSQCIRAMLQLVMLYAHQQGKENRIAAVRNVHKTFLTAAALLDTHVDWLYPAGNAGYLSCDLIPDELDRYLQTAEDQPAAVYVTSPDYLGKIADISGLAAVCHKHDVLLVVDNAHGGYLKFLPTSEHPMDLGADLCCDSAHKTLPVLTGGAYLHLSPKMERVLGHQARNALMIFGSTSPSYLILQSLDVANLYLTTYPDKLKTMVCRAEALKKRLCLQGYCLYGDEPLKLTIDAKPYGYTGLQLADYLRLYRMEPEFADPDYMVLLLSAQMEETDIMRLEQVLCELPRKTPIAERCPMLIRSKQVMAVRDAMFADSEELPVAQCLGRVLSVPTVGCPPAVPILVCGELIDDHAVECFAYYGTERCFVVKV